MNVTNIIIIIIGIGILIGIILFIVKLKKTNIVYTNIDILKAETIIAFFKQPDILTKLNENKNLLAVAVKKDENKTCALCLFDKELNEVKEKIKVYKFKKLDNDLSTMFTDKDMIIIQ